MRFHYRGWGDPAHPPLVLLHGLCAHSHTFDGLGSELAARYHVIAPDLRGHGETSWAEDYRWERWVEDIEALRNALGVDSLSLLGHSAGGWFAYLYAGLAPSRVERLVVAEAAPREASEAPQAVRSAGDAFYAAASFADFDDALRRARATGTHATEDALRERLRHNLRPLPDGRLAWRYDLRVVTANAAGELRPDPATEWQIAAKVACPTLVLRGALSSFARDAAAQARVRRFTALVPAAQVHDVEAAGHGLWMDQAERTLDVLRSFL